MAVEATALDVDDDRHEAAEAACHRGMAGGFDFVAVGVFHVCRCV
jgi:hypothetical protein